MAASRLVTAGTLLFTNSGATLGVPKITLVDGCINDGSVALLNIQEPTKSFLYHFLNTQTDRLRNLKQGAAQPNLNTEIVRQIPVPLPSIEEQERVVGLLENDHSAVDLRNLNSLQSESKSLRQSILSAAFRGDLLPS